MDPSRAARGLIHQGRGGGGGGGGVQALHRSWEVLACVLISTGKYHSSILPFRNGMLFKFNYLGVTDLQCVHACMHVGYAYMNACIMWRHACYQSVQNHLVLKYILGD